MCKALYRLTEELQSFGREYGFTTCVQNLGLTLFPLVVGRLNDYTKGFVYLTGNRHNTWKACLTVSHRYTAGLAFLAVMSLVGAAMCGGCYWFDKQRVLQAPAAVFIQRDKKTDQNGANEEEMTPMRRGDGLEVERLAPEAGEVGEQKEEVR